MLKAAGILSCVAWCASWIEYNPAVKVAQLQWKVKNRYNKVEGSPVVL